MCAWNDINNCIHHASEQTIGRKGKQKIGTPDLAEQGQSKIRYTNKKKETVMWNCKNLCIKYVGTQKELQK